MAKPGWTLDGGTIGLIWAVLDPVIAVSFGSVFVQAVCRKISRSVAVPFAVNLSFTPIQFGRRNLPLAAADILVVHGTIGWSMHAVWPHARRAAAVPVPYLVWVGTATVLHLSIPARNG